jgi:hypothetical protein
MSHYDDEEEQALVTPTAAGSRLMNSNSRSRGLRNVRIPMNRWWARYIGHYLIPVLCGKTPSLANSVYNTLVFCKT